MIVVAGTLSIPPERHDDFVAAATTVSEATRLEAGCQTYEFWSDMAARGRFVVFEEWDSMELLDAHMKAPHLAVFQAQLEEIGLTDSTVQRYVVSEILPL